MTTTRRVRFFTRRRPLSVLAVCFTLAAVAAAYVSIFCLNCYTVTSNSMSPTLMGNDDLRDRVLCWMRSFPGRDPRPWEIVIFHTPDAENLELLSAGRKLSLQHDMTIKRVVGLGGETLALRNGDVWVRRVGGKDAPYERRVKPRAVQDGLWIPVYEAVFPAVRADEFTRYWRSRNGGAADASDGLFLPPGAEFRFRPLMRTGKIGREVRELSGVPDRYLLPQNLTFRCDACGASFTRWFAGGRVRERCPECAVTAYEENVLVYSHDSGLTIVGPDAVTGIPSGNANRMRVYPYHTVGDLRIAMELLLPYAGSSLTLRLEKNGNVDSIVLNESIRPEIRGKKWFRVEFARVDGELRLTIDGEPAPLPASATAGSSGEMSVVEIVENASSGVSFEVDSAGVLTRRISVSRDVHYFSGVGSPYMPQFSAMTPESEILIPNGAFFTMGDNADVSLDSRAWGTLPYSLLAGTAIWWDTGEHLPGARFGEDAPERGRH